MVTLSKHTGGGAILVNPSNHKPVMTCTQATLVATARIARLTSTLEIDSPGSATSYANTCISPLPLYQSNQTISSETSSSSSNDTILKSVESHPLMTPVMRCIGASLYIICIGASIFVIFRPKHTHFTIFWVSNHLFFVVYPLCVPNLPFYSYFFCLKSSIHTFTDGVAAIVRGEVDGKGSCHRMCLSI